MTLDKSKKISIKIIVLFTIAIFSTFIGEYLSSFFGDYYCTLHHVYGGEWHKEPKTHWGYRHWLYMFMCITLFIIQAINIIDYATNPKK